MAISYTSEMKFPLQADGGYNWGSIANGVYELLDKGHELTLVAGENIAAGDCVALKTDGLIYKALNTDQTLTPAIGFAPAAITSGDSGKVRGFGYIDVDTSYASDDEKSWSPGQACYVGRTAGRLIKSHESWGNYLGYAKSHTPADYTTRFVIDPSERVQRFVSQLQVDESAYFSREVDNGNSGASKTIDWRDGNKQKVVLTGDATFTFTAPNGPCNLVFKMIQDGTGSRSPTWPATVKWPGGTEPTWTTTAWAVDIVCFYFDGLNYYGSDALDMQ